MYSCRFLKFLDSFILFLLFVFLVCEHHIKFTAIKNISLYAAFLSVLLLFFYNKKELILNFKENIKIDKFTLFSLLGFVFYALLISAFPYDDSYNSLKEAFEEFGRGLAFLFIIFLWSNGDKKKTKWLFVSLVVAFFLISLHYAGPLFSKFSYITSNVGEEGRIIRRSYSEFVDRFFPFLAIFIIIFWSKFNKILGILFLLLVLFMDILSGTRGSWLTIFTQSILLFLALFFTHYRDFLKKNAKILLSFSVLTAVLLTLLISFSSIAKWKISQGAYTSGRVELVKERFPVFLDSDRGLWGLGYGKFQYDEFLRDENDKGREFSMIMIRKESGNRYWFNDEPFFIGNYFYYGAFGTAMLFLTFFGILKSSFIYFRQTENLIFVAIFISVFGYIGVRGIFETINLRILYLFYMYGFLILLGSMYRRKNEC